MALASRHVADLGGLIDKLIHAQQGKVTKHQFGDGAHAGHGGTDTETDVAFLGDGGIDDPVAAEFVPQALAALEDTPGLSHILTDEKNRFVAPHLLCHGLANGLAKCDFAGPRSRHE